MVVDGVDGGAADDTVGDTSIVEVVVGRSDGQLLVGATGNNNSMIVSVVVADGISCRGQSACQFMLALVRVSDGVGLCWCRR